MLSLKKRENPILFTSLDGPFSSLSVSAVIHALSTHSVHSWPGTPGLGLLACASPLTGTLMDNDLKLLGHPVV